MRVPKNTGGGEASPSETTRRTAWEGSGKKERREENTKTSSDSKKKKRERGLGDVKRARGRSIKERGG